MEQQDKDLPKYVRSEFEAYLKCGRLEYGFLRVRCEYFHNEHLVAFSCKRRGFCPSCGARRMAESAALLVDDVLPHESIRQWVLCFPFQLRFLFASYPQIIGKVLGIVYRTLATHITKKADYNTQTAQTGAVTLIQRFGSALNLNIHFHKKERGQVACFTILLINPSTRVLNRLSSRVHLLLLVKAGAVAKLIYCTEMQLSK
jgi:hypothetical protein